MISLGICMGGKSQRKGRRAELELASVLKGYGFESVQPGEAVSYGTVPDVVGLPGVHIECKRCEQLRIAEWAEQAERDAERFQDGLPAVFSTAGNAYAHVVLRGGHEPNFDAAHVAECERRLRAARLPANIVVDCSHANSHKRPEEQGDVLRAVLAQIEAGNASIRGVMLESFLEWGAQKIPKDLRALRPGLSVTDACIDWPTTETLLREMRERLAPVVASRRR